MLQALISDIHGNLPALEAVLADAKQQGASRIICLGDVIGYGPQPGRCLDLVYSCGAVIMGNHEEALIKGAEEMNFNPRARKAIDWTRRQIDTTGSEEDQRRRHEVLNNLKIQAKLGRYLFTHGSPRQPTREYVMPQDIRNRAKMDEIFSMMPHLCFAGHTHVAGVFLPDYSFTPPTSLFAQTYFVDPQEKAFINVGSVGQPRDGDTRACYCLLNDDDERTIEIRYRRVEYDVEQTAKLIETVDELDNSLARRLRLGR